MTVLMRVSQQAKAPCTVAIIPGPVDPRAAPKAHGRSVAMTKERVGDDYSGILHG